MPTTQELIQLTSAAGQGDPRTQSLFWDIVGGGADLIAENVIPGYSTVDRFIDLPRPSDFMPGGGDEAPETRGAPPGWPGQAGPAQVPGGGQDMAPWMPGAPGGGGAGIPGFPGSPGQMPQPQFGADFAGPGGGQGGGVGGAIGQMALQIARYVTQHPELTRAVLSSIRMKLHAQGQGGPGWRMSEGCAAKYREHLRPAIREALDAYGCGMPSVIGGSDLADEVFLALVMASQGYATAQSCGCK